MLVGAAAFRIANHRRVRRSQAKAVGRAVALEPQVDASLLGGLVVKVGSRMVDGSIKTKLQRLPLAMKGVG